MDSNKFLWKSGEKAPSGFYCCAKCNDDGNTISHDRDGEELPECSVCGKTIWAKI